MFKRIVDLKVTKEIYGGIKTNEKPKHQECGVPSGAFLFAKMTFFEKLNKIRPSLIIFLK